MKISEIIKRLVDKMVENGDKEVSSLKIFSGERRVSSGVNIVSIPCLDIDIEWKDEQSI